MAEAKSFWSHQRHGHDGVRASPSRSGGQKDAALPRAAQPGKRSATIPAGPRPSGLPGASAVLPKPTPPEALRPTPGNEQSPLTASSWEVALGESPSRTSPQVLACSPHCEASLLAGHSSPPTSLAIIPVDHRPAGVAPVGLFPARGAFPCTRSPRRRPRRHAPPATSRLGPRPAGYCSRRITAPRRPPRREPPCRDRPVGRRPAGDCACSRLPPLAALPSRFPRRKVP